MENINKLRKIYQLKNIERANTVGKRKESPAEHSWSSLILADYFLTEMNDSTLDRLKVYELIMYHDLVEIETGDLCISKEEERKNKKAEEKKAALILKEKIPSQIKQKFHDLFEEYENQTTQEAKFAKAIDALDAELHEMDYKEDWKGWTEEFLRKKKSHLFQDFPLLKEAFEKTTQYARENGYFNQ